MENDDLLSDIGLDNLPDTILSDNPSSEDVLPDDQGSSYFVDLQPIIERLDTIELLLSEPVTQVTESPVRVFNSLDQALLFMILVVASCIFLFRGKN